MRFVILLSLFGLSFYPLKAQHFLKIWPPGKMPNTRGMVLEEIISRQRITQVDTPGLEIFLTSNEENSTAAIMICPPGGYQKLTYVLAGRQWAKWLNTIGINAFVLKYRLPNSVDLLDRAKGPLQDAQRAIRYIRSHAAKYKINPDKIGVMGSSAGGHLAALLATYNKDESAIGDSLDQVSFSVASMILISPVITMGIYSHQGSKENLLGPNPTDAMIKQYSVELLINSNTAPAFIVHAANDDVADPRNSLLLFQAMVDKGCQASSLHIFPYGGHSIGLRHNPGSTKLWPQLCEKWLKEIGFLK